MLSLYIASLLGELSIFPALASVSVMSRTFNEGLRECRNQAVGILIGGVFGCVTVFLFHQPPIWLMGIGVMLIIFVCASFHVGFSCSLSCAIFIVACMTDESQVLPNVLLRFYHTAIGLGTGLVINYLVVPYKNSKKIYALLQELIDQIPDYLHKRLFEELYPDLSPIETLLEHLDYEMTIYRHQRYVQKRFYRDEYPHMVGCVQLAQGIHQELQVLCSLETIGQLNIEQLSRLQLLGVELPDHGLPIHSSTQEDDTVTGYHLKRLLDSRSYLLHLMEERET